MRKILLFCFVLITIVACREENFDKNNPPVSSSVSGKVIDPTTKSPISNVDFELRRSWYQYRGSGIGRNLHDELVAKFKTDINGFYKQCFNFIPAGEKRDEYYYYLKYDNKYRRENFEKHEIQAGENNNMNFYLWYPIKFIYTINVKNLKSPPFIFRITCNDYQVYTNQFNHNTLYTQDGTIKDFAFIRPNSNCIIHFQYYTKDAVGISIMHEKTILLRTNTEQQIQREFEIDCSTF